MTHKDIPQKHRKTGRAIGVMLAFIGMMACALGYQVGADVAAKDNARDRTAQVR